MKRLKFFLNFNPVSLKIDQILFYKTFLLSVLMLRLLPTITALANYDREYSNPVYILKFLLDPPVVLFSAIGFIALSVILLLKDFPNRYLRVALFIVYFILHGAMNSIVKVNYNNHAFLVLLLVLALVPDSEFKNPEKNFFNQQLFNALRLILVVYFISGFHKLSNFLTCRMDEKCLQEDSFLVLQILDFANLRDAKVPFDFVFQSFSATQFDLIYSAIIFIEIFSIFAVLSIRLLKIELIALTLMHLLIGLFMNIHFPEFIATHLLFLAFCLGRESQGTPFIK